MGGLNQAVYVAIVLDQGAPAAREVVLLNDRDSVACLRKTCRGCDATNSGACTGQLQLVSHWKKVQANCTNR